MKNPFANMNPTLRGFLIVGLIALAVVVLELYQTLRALFILARVAFLLAIAFFVYLVWRERRHDIGLWPDRARWVFYGAAVLIVLDFLVWFVQGIPGSDALAFVLVLLLCGYSMVRTWRDQHNYS